MVTKFKNMSGHYTYFIPGWDCHGLPIELVVEKQLREQKKDKSAIDTEGVMRTIDLIFNKKIYK